MSYVVLARKYRPQSFEDLVGQEHVAQTLAGAIAQGRIAHAFLFTGVRGVGKTTSARLLAKALNCLGADGKADGPTATPCQVCAACTEIAQGSDLDVQEIDGASYNGVDEVRRLQEGMNFRPARDRYKIYIVDEVHMLSQAAWNAFLKTLEEPPPHVKFLFATTEVHKVPVTILSRCQRYDFKLITSQVIARRLREVMDAEGLTADEGALALLARQAEGSMRDAMSLLDRVIAFAPEGLREDEVSRILGVAGKRALFAVGRAVLEGDAAAVLQVVRHAAESGVDLVHFARDILGFFRDLVAAGVAESALAELVLGSDDERRELAELAATTKLDDLLRLFHGFSRGFDDMLRQPDLRAGVEMALVRLARRPPLLPLDDLLGRIGELERRIAAGGSAAPPPRGGGGGGRQAGRPMSRVADIGARGGVGPLREERGQASAAPISYGALALAPALDAPRREAKRLDPRPAEPDFTLHMPEPEEPDPSSAPPESSGAAESQPQRPSTPPSARPLRGAPVLGAKVDPVAFRAIVEAVENEHPALGSALRHAALLEVGRERCILGFEADSFLLSLVHEADSIDHVTRAVRAHFDHATEVALDLSPKVSQAAPSLADVDEHARAQALAAARAAVENHPAVQAAIRTLGAELRDVKLPD